MEKFYTQFAGKRQIIILEGKAFTQREMGQAAAQGAQEEVGREEDGWMDGWQLGMHCGVVRPPFNSLRSGGNEKVHAQSAQRARTTSAGVHLTCKRSSNEGFFFAINQVITLTKNNTHNLITHGNTNASAANHQFIKFMQTTTYYCNVTQYNAQLK